MKYLTQYQLLAYLQKDVGLPVTMQWLRNSIKTGNCPAHIKPSPRKCLFEFDDIERWLGTWTRFPVQKAA